MAAVIPPADQAANLLKNLSLDSQTNSLEISEPTKKPSVDIGNGQVQQPSNKSVTPLIPNSMDSTVAYYPNAYAYNACYYGGYDGTTNNWDDYSRYVNLDGYGYGYAPYGPYSPAGSPFGHDGQFYSAQHYQYPSPCFQPLTPTVGPSPAASDHTVLSTDTAKQISNGGGNGVGPKGTNGYTSVKPTQYQNSGHNANGSYGMGAQNGYQDPKYGFDGVYSPISWLDSPMYSDLQRRNNTNNGPFSYGNSVASKNFMNPRPISGMNTTCGYMNRMDPNKLYNQYNPRGRVNGFFGYNNENGDGLNELNRGPRARTIKNQKVFTPITIAVKGQNITSPAGDDIEKEVKDVCLTPDREQYNQIDFSETYSDARFFIIKSYSEDDVHKSIKYNVWASTPNGNKKLDGAYNEALQKSETCPVFLFFSVNTSGQFVGVAEMVGPVDFNKSLEYWQQDKWIGCFPVKWHIVKDLPNSLLKHIILEYNENKPVTNSRDTQEVRLDQGLQMLKVFKEQSSKQCILDDFDFYEDRQKKIQEKKAKQQQFQKQAWEGKPIIDENKVEILPPKSAHVVLDLVNEVKPLEKKVVVNGVASCC